MGQWVSMDDLYIYSYRVNKMMFVSIYFSEWVSIGMIELIQYHSRQTPEKTNKVCALICLFHLFKPPT